MSGSRTVFAGGPIFDGTRLLEGHALIVEDGRVVALEPDAHGGPHVDLAGDVLSPGFVDLQVNGGGGVMLNDAPTVSTVIRIAAAHRALGTAHLLPTLITDAPEATRAAIEAVAMAVEAGAPGIAGLHLEGPHLSLAKKGAHDPALVRPMTDADCAMLCEAARRLPALMVTLAPENATPAQTRALNDAGAVVSLGHSDADYAACMAHVEAGARAATHLFNAMSQCAARAPGLVGAALDSGRLSCGLIADGVHVHPASMRAAFAAKRGPGGIFLVTDAMAVAGTGETAFTLNGRVIRRAGGRLTLADGTLAGADLDMLSAVRMTAFDCGQGVERALAAATSIPARLMNLSAGAGALTPGAPCSLIRLSPRLDRVSAPMECSEAWR